MKNVRFSWLVFCALLFIGGCRSPSQSWNGTWRLNVSKSSFQGPVIAISISADGVYRDDDGNVNTTFRCDGKYRSIGNNLTQNCVTSSATTLDKTRMEGGVTTNTSHWELSAGGKVLTVTATAFRPNGPILMGQLVAMRISGSNGFAGQWRDISSLQRHAELTLRRDNQYLHIGYPSAGEYVDAPLNGANAPMYGPHPLVGVRYAIRWTGRRELLILGSHNGKAFNQVSLKLSDDGTTITDFWEDPTRPTYKATLVYEKK